MDAATIRDDDVVYYFAASLDGFIAAPDGGVDWLNPYFVPELNFHGFMTRINGAIMGRATFDKMVSLTGGKSAYGDTPVTVATTRPLDAEGPVHTAAGAPADLLAAARAAGPGPYWIVGGADLATQFLDAGLLTRIDWFIIPVLLGDGLPAFRNRATTTLSLIDAQTYPNGIVRASWRPTA